MTPDAPQPGELDGLNTSDPGIRMLARLAEPLDPASLLLVHCGDLPGLRAGATRLILDVREHTGSAHRCIPDLGGSDLPFGDARFEAAMVWPRAHLGKDFSEACLAVGALGLREGGRLFCAVRKQKGGKSLGKVMRALLGESVEVVARDRGYHVWSGIRGPQLDAALAQELISRSYVIHDPALGELALTTRPGVFSRRELDAGTRALMAVAEAIWEQDRATGQPLPNAILDVCAGVGPLALFAASRLPHAEVLAIESNLRACALLRHNAAHNQLADRVRTIEHDGLPEITGTELGPVDMILLNPPTHANTQTLRRLLDVRAWLRPGGRLLLVVSRPHRTLELLHELGASVDGGERDGYVVLQARWSP